MSASESHTPHSRDIVISIVEAVSDRSGTPVTELPPLYDAINPEALNQLFPAQNGDRKLTFRYAGFEVTVDEHQDIHLSR